MTGGDEAPPPRARRNHRRLVAGLLALVMALLAADALLWRWADGQLELAFAAWASGARAHGWTVSAAPPLRSGWPLAAEITLADPTVSAGRPGLPGEASWTAAAVSLRITLRHPHTLIVALVGAQRVRVSGIADVPFTANRFLTRILLEPGVPAHAGDLEIAQLRAGVGTGGLTLAHARAHADWKPAAQQGEAVLTLTADAADLVLPAGDWPLGPRIGSAGLNLTLMGPLPPAGAPLPRATAWRDGGGTLELQRIALEWGPLNLTGSATLALDEHMQPMGAATARIAGYAATLDALAATHMIGAGAARTAKAVLGLMAQTPGNGGPAEVDVPFTLQDGTLSVGRIPLIRMPELSWPDAP